jgi:hypothetical protein
MRQHLPDLGVEAILVTLCELYVYSSHFSYLLKLLLKKKYLYSHYSAASSCLRCVKFESIKRIISLRFVDIVMGPAYYNILKHLRSLILHEEGNPAFMARHTACLGEIFFCRPGLAWNFWCGANSLASHQAVRWSSLKLVSSL